VSFEVIPDPRSNNSHKNLVQELEEIFMRDWSSKLAERINEIEIEIE
jgi:hypothetical protein